MPSLDQAVGCCGRRRTNQEADHDRAICESDRVEPGDAREALRSILVVVGYQLQQELVGCDGEGSEETGGGSR